MQSVFFVEYRYVRMLEVDEGDLDGKTIYLGPFANIHDVGEPCVKIIFRGP